MFPSITLHSSKFSELEIKPMVRFWVLQVFPATAGCMSYELKLVFCEIPCKLLVSVSMV